MSPDILVEALKALLLGITEGITEWLPISSTGHMILVDEFVKLNVSDKFLELFLVVIQIGSIMAVVVTFWHKLNPVSRTKDETERRNTWHMWGMVVIGSIPAAALGLALDDWVHDHFYNAYTVAAMLILYGIIFIVLEAHNRKRAREVIESAEQPRGKHARKIDASDPESVESALFRITDPYDMDWKTALKIGFFEVLAIVPGTSRFAIRTDFLFLGSWEGPRGSAGMLWARCGAGVDLARGRVDSMQRQGIARPRRLGAVRVPCQGVVRVRHRDVAPLPR
ncbi:undecaprenyl-diphosphatase [Eggerthella sp. CAG:209]|nr:undecaprenyl-diphosphatase [Eggerthella sp. CAG:209]